MLSGVAGWERGSELKAWLATLFKINTALCNDVPGRPGQPSPDTALEYSRNIVAWHCLGGCLTVPPLDW